MGGARAQGDHPWFFKRQFKRIKVFKKRLKEPLDKMVSGNYITLKKGLGLGRAFPNNVRKKRKVSFEGNS